MTENELDEEGGTVMLLAGIGSDSNQQLLWTKRKPAEAGWYWMLNHEEEPSLPTIVQLVYDWKSRQLIALVPASRYPTRASAVVDPEQVDALWAGPLAIPSVACGTHLEADIAA